MKSRKETNYNKNQIIKMDKTVNQINREKIDQQAS